MYPTMEGIFLEVILLEVSRTAVSTCSAGIALFAIGLLAAKKMMSYRLVARTGLWC